MFKVGACGCPRIDYARDILYVDSTLMSYVGYTKSLDLLELNAGTDADAWALEFIHGRVRIFVNYTHRQTAL